MRSPEPNSAIGLIVIVVMIAVIVLFIRFTH
jgi:hypothetical protein